MYVIIMGCGRVGARLAHLLVSSGHEVLVLDTNASAFDRLGRDFPGSTMVGNGIDHDVLLNERSGPRCEMIANELGNVVMRGNADEASVLAEAGTNRADVVVAVTGDDEDNLVICQVAKRRFNVPRAVARINNPKNES